jgi:hypothetical protein
MDFFAAIRGICMVLLPELSSLRSQTLGAKGPRDKGNKTPSGILYPFAPLSLGSWNKFKKS